MLRVLLMMFFLFNTTISKADSWVEVTSVTPGTSNMKIFNYTYSWPYETSTAQVSECISGCLISAFFETGRIHEWSNSALLIITESDKCFDMQCIWQKWVEKFGTGLSYGQWQTGQADASNYCWAFAAFPITTMSAPTGQGVRLPNAYCGMPPPINVQCEISFVNDFDHGTVEDTKVDGSEASQSAYLECNDDADVNFYLAAGSAVQMTNGDEEITSDISINGSKVTSTEPYKLKVESGSTPIEITSTLRASGKVSGGVFTGSDVLILNIL